MIVRWSHGSGRPDSNDDTPYVRGMSVSFVLPDGKSTDLLGQTVPRFPVRTPEDFVRLSEVARDRRELAQVRGDPAAHGGGAGGQRAGEGAGRRRRATPRRRTSRSTPTAGCPCPGTAPGCATGWCPRPLRRTACRRSSRDVTGCGEEIRARLAPGTGDVRPGRHRRRAEGRPAQPDVGVEGQPRVRGRLVRDHHPGGRPRGRRATSSSSTRPAWSTGIELSDDPILRYRPSAYSVSIERRSQHP